MMMVFQIITSSISDRWPDMAAGSVWHSFISILCSSRTLQRMTPDSCCCGSSQLSTSCSIIGTLISWMFIGCGGSTHMSTDPRIVSNLRQACVSAANFNNNRVNERSFAVPHPKQPRSFQRWSSLDRLILTKLSNAGKYTLHNSINVNIINTTSDPDSVPLTTLGQEWVNRV